MTPREEETEGRKERWGEPLTKKHGVGVQVLRRTNPNGKAKLGGVGL